MKASRAVKKVMQAYEDCFTTGAGQVVLEDMRAAYHDRAITEPDAAGSDLPPEVRIWFREGQRDAYLSILRMIDANKATTSEDDTDDRPAD